MTTAPADRPSRFTSEQSRAIETQHVSVSLSAGAGCGKTFVLTERFLSCFDPDRPGSLSPSDLSRVVAITFTDRAAREMRQRVRLKCYERLEGADTPERIEHWTALLRGLDDARISTIHSFCGWLLRSRAAAAGVDPQFQVLEEAQSSTLLLSVVDDELRRLIAERDPATIDLAVRFDLTALGAMLHSLVREFGGGRFENWLDRTAEEQLARWESFHRDHVVPAVAHQLAASPSARAVLEVLHTAEPTNPIMRERRRVLLETLGALTAGSLVAGDLAATLNEIRQCAQVQGGGRADSWPSADAHASFRDAATKLRGQIDKLTPLTHFDAAKAREAADVGMALLTIAAGVAERYDRRKRDLAVMDFDDLLCEARKLLVDPAHDAVRRQLGSQIRLLLIDEFQDTDPLQVELVEALCGEAMTTGKLFFVGDSKQSIYRFRGADPRVFRRLRSDTPEAGRLTLGKNFRSQPAILQFVNALFADDLEGYEPLTPHRSQANSNPCIEFLWAPAAGPKESKELLVRREADWIAQRVRNLLDSREPLVGDAKDGATLRPARPGDIAILFRALSDVRHYEAALRRRGVDYYLVGGHAFYAQQEIFDLVNLLRAVASPSDSVSLAGVLRTGFFSLTDETIFWLGRHRDGLQAGLFAAEYPVEMPPEEEARARFAAATLEHLRGCKDRLSTSALIGEALARTGYDAALVNEFLGDRKLANLRKFVELARGFDKSGLFSLGEFTNQMIQFVARQPQEPLAATLGENMNVVRLMTIHKAKGLEFPIVIVPDLDRSKVNQPPRVHLDANLGPLVKLRDDDDGDAPLNGFDLWQFAENEEELAELTRLLYVATTRAADYLILSGGFQTLGATKGPWAQLLARRFDLLTGRPIVPLPAGETCPPITVTPTEPPSQGRGVPQRSTLDLASVVEALASAQPTQVALRRLIDPIAPDFAAPRRYSFSMLTGTLATEDDPVEEAPRAKAPDVDRRALGTLVHAVLAAMDFAGSEPWRPLVRLHAERLQIDGAAEADDAAELIERFMATPRARVLAAARQSLAEVEFLLAWPPDGAAEMSGNALVGYIDRLYQDAAGQWHVLDFKTSRVVADGVAQAAASYEMQMLVYALATQQILGSPPASLTLHFLPSSAEHAFEWNASARERAIVLVDRAIAADIAENERSWAASTTYRALDRLL